MITKQQCFDNDDAVVYLDFYNVARYLTEHGFGKNIDDAMMEMFPEWANKGNDSYWHLYRDWIPDYNDDGRALWDTICSELDINQDIPATASGYKPSLKLVFWVSW